MSELKPCPSCGASSWEHKYLIYSLSHEINCYIRDIERRSGGIGKTEIHESDVMKIERWNTRSALTIDDVLGWMESERAKNNEYPVKIIIYDSGASKAVYARGLGYDYKILKNKAQLKELVRGESGGHDE